MNDFKETFCIYKSRKYYEEIVQNKWKFSFPVAVSAVLKSDKNDLMEIFTKFYGNIYFALDVILDFTLPLVLYLFLLFVWRDVPSVLKLLWLIHLLVNIYLCIYYFFPSLLMKTVFYSSFLQQSENKL